MKTTFLIVLAALGLGLSSLSADIAPTRVRTSPHDTISANLDQARIIIVYGRPYSKDPKSGALRKIWGNLVPSGEVWRAGSDEATLLIAQKGLAFGTTKIPAGAYSLYVFLDKNGNASLLINRAIGQWGAEPYPEKQELARIALQKDALTTALDQFTMGIEKNLAGGGVIKLAWENTQFSAPFTVSP